MSKTLLDLSNPFSITLRDQHSNETELKGTFREYTKAETADAKKRFKKLSQITDKIEEIQRKIVRNAKQIEIKEKLNDYQEVDRLFSENVTLEDELIKIGKTLDEEAVEGGMKDRFNACLGGEDREEILKLADQIGYKTVYEAIVTSIAEGKREQSKD